MSFISVFFIVLAFLAVYYAGMVVYDIYVDNQAQAEAEVNTEIPIDVSDQLEGFESCDIIKPEDSTVRKQKFIQWLSQGLTADRMNSLMYDAAEGLQTPVLSNICYMLEEMEKQGLSEKEMEEVIKAYEQSNSEE